MKNIHVLPTDKPSTICKINNVLVLSKIGIITNNTKSLICQNIYITSDEEIKEGVNEWYLDKFINKPRNSSGSQYSEKQDVIILTSDQDLIKDGVQAIDDEFLEWFVKNPSCEEVGVSTYHVKGDISGKLHYKIIIPKEEPKQETFEEIAKECLRNNNLPTEGDFAEGYVVGSIFGAKWQQERSYSEEEVKLILFARDTYYQLNTELLDIDEWFEQFKNK